MFSGKKVTGCATPMLVGLGIGLTFGMVMLLILCVVLSWLVLRGIIAENTIGYGIMAALFVSVFLSAVVAASKIKRRRMMVCLLTGALILLVLLLATAIFFGAQYQGIVTTVLVVLAGSVGAGAIGHKRREAYRLRKLKMQSC